MRVTSPVGRPPWSPDVAACPPDFEAICIKLGQGFTERLRRLLLLQLFLLISSYDH